MSKLKTVMVTSSKGGVGKTTVTAHLAMTLAHMGKKVLAVDMDFDSRCLDLVTGVEDHVVYDVSDLLCGTVPAERAVVCHPEQTQLYICAAPAVSTDQAGEDAALQTVTAEDFQQYLVRYAEENAFDFLLLDTPGTPGTPFRLASGAAQIAIVVATQQPSAIRAAELTARRLQAADVPACRLLINLFDPESILDKIAPGAVEVVDRTYLQLIGILPEDKLFPDCQQQGLLLGKKRNNNPARALYNIARRLCGEQVPLLSGLKRISKYGLKR